MTLTLDLPADLEKDLVAEATRMGLSLPEYALRVLAAGYPAAGRPRTGRDLVAYWQAEGLIGSRPDITDSASHARELRARAERRARQ
jgi:hypothetical protein